MKGSAKDIIGKAQQKAGKLTGSKKHQVKGLGKQVAGKAQKAYGDVRSAADKAERGR